MWRALEYSIIFFVASTIELGAQNESALGIQCPPLSWWAAVGTK